MKIGSLCNAGSLRAVVPCLLSGCLLVLGPALGGCAEAYDQPAAYPSASVSGSAEESSTRSASLEANPPAPPQEIAIGVDEKAYADTDPTALTEFRSTLEPYGNWVEDANYGVVWVPSPKVVGADFAPYVSAGHWAYDDDWVWVSDYSWGWAPFHYGRWVAIPGRGWSWIPGRTYRGAWVTWRLGYGAYDYIGWAPMAPSWYWRGGYAVGFYVAPTPTYYYCPHRDVFSPAIAGRIVPPSRVPPIASNTRPYYPADPTVGGGRSVATPTVGGDRVAARPDLGHGPPPATIGYAAPGFARPPASDSGLSRARAFATPSTAVAVGARPPQGFAPPPTPVPVAIGAGRPGVLPTGPTRLPDHVGAAPRPYISPYTSPTVVGRTSVPRPMYGPSSSLPPSPTFRSSPSISAPYRAPTFSPPPPPVFHHAPSPMFHGGGSFGGGGGSFHGGGGSFGGGGGHSPATPSIGGGRSVGGRR
ncbi:hypothetical protein LVJ94_40135 [Pendulispora rubella]|uniref:Uncharacterized protein n=1 Tax=Pendulispora rubella TaxID=2741070 RepID=A0ABZ2L1J9_9BACT